MTMNGFKTNLLAHFVRTIKQVHNPQNKLIVRSLKNISLYYIDTSVLLENTPLVKFIRNHIRDSSGVFSISSLVRISMISLISSLSLKLYLNSLVYDRNIFGSSSKVFGNLRKFLENVRQPSCNIQTNFGESSEIFGKWPEIFGKSSISPSLVCLYNKKNITRWLEDMNFMFSWQE